ncbi:toxin-antitoxin system TumE family protein [Kamptonema formosum]|uniref:toxin-antitoxin system TumE family protein n=1 Tax=Kamptonema formosum TaxID=331992 RepID=UPI00034D225F|nr:DUF6516 family protein [Oscillatoria sp. PCC 10802]
MEAQEYLKEIQTQLLASFAVATFSVIEDYALPERGYFRARLTLSNGEFLEIAEYFTVEEGRCVTQRYRYQWMDKSQQVLRKRWDNVKHFPHLPNFPHHVHIGEESNVEPSRSLSIVELIDILEQELGA